MKKIILLLFLFGSLLFGYQVTDSGLYVFTDSELETLFGPNLACKGAGWVMFNEGRIKYFLKGTSVYADAIRASGRNIELVNDIVIEEEEWYQEKDSYRNLSKFYIKYCPKTHEKTARNILSKKEVKMMRRLNMTKLLKGKKTEMMDRYGNYYEEKCESYVIHTYADGSQKLGWRCWDERIEDV